MKWQKEGKKEKARRGNNRMKIIYFSLFSLFLIIFSVSAAVNIEETPEDIAGVVIARIQRFIDTFLDLSDTPSTYSGSANLCVVVNAGATGLVFVACNATGSINQSTFAEIWITSDGGNLDDVGDIDHSLLDNLNWFDSGHTMDTDLDMNSNDIDEVNDLYVENDIHLGDRIENDGDATTYWQIGIGSMNYYISGIQLINMVKKMITIKTNVTIEQNLTVLGNVSVGGRVCDSTGCIVIDTNFTTECGDGEYGDGSGSCINFNDSVKSLFAEEQIVYNATLIFTEIGTVDSGDLTSIQTFGDGNTYNVSEVPGAPGFLIYVNFTNVVDFNILAIRGMYDGGAGHTIDLELFRLSTQTWDDFGDITDQPDFGVTSFPIFIGSNFINTTHDGGTVQFRFNHDDNGIASHNYFLDAIFLGQITGLVAGGDHDDTLGRDNCDTNHPGAMCANGSIRNFTDNVFGDLGINATFENLFGKLTASDNPGTFLEATGKMILGTIDDIVIFNVSINAFTSFVFPSASTRFSIGNAVPDNIFEITSNEADFFLLKSTTDNILKVLGDTEIVEIKELNVTEDLEVTENTVMRENLTLDGFPKGKGFNLTMQQVGFNDTTISYTQDANGVHNITLVSATGVKYVRYEVCAYIADATGNSDWKIDVMDCDGNKLATTYCSVQQLGLEVTLHDSCCASGIDTDLKDNCIYNINIDETQGAAVMFVESTELIKYVDGDISPFG